MAFAEMAIVIYAANEGYLKDVEVNKILSFEDALLSYMNGSKAELMDRINETGDYNDEIEAAFKAAMDDFVATQTW